MPSVFTIQGADLSAIAPSDPEVGKLRLTEPQMDTLCDLSTELNEKAKKTRSETRRFGLRKAAQHVDSLVMQHGGHSYFWSGRCGLKRQRR